MLCVRGGGNARYFEQYLSGNMSLARSSPTLHIMISCFGTKCGLTTGIMMTVVHFSSLTRIYFNI
jgi:hypothetical protein